MTDANLIAAARAVLAPRQVSGSVHAGSVGAALLTPGGEVFCGVCLDTACSLGFCAEHAAVAAMLTAGRDRVLRIVAVGDGGGIVAPCGRCRELLWQLGGAEVLMPGPERVPLAALLPRPWGTPGGGP